VFYASEGSSLIFLSAPKTRHCQNLAQDPRCAATIHEDCISKRPRRRYREQPRRTAFTTLPCRKTWPLVRREPGILPLKSRRISIANLT